MAPFVFEIERYIVLSDEREHEKYVCAFTGRGAVERLQGERGGLHGDACFPKPICIFIQWERTRAHRAMARMVYIKKGIYSFK